MITLTEWRCQGHTRHGQKCTKLLGIFDPVAPGEIKCPSCGHLNIRRPPDRQQQPTEAIEPFSQATQEGSLHATRDQVHRR